MIGSTIAGILQGTVKPILDKFIPDANERLEAENLLLKSVLASDLAQAEINKTEAGNTSVFVAGWRPAIGWICGGAYAYHFVVQPFLLFCMTLIGYPINQHDIPHIEMSELSMVLFGMLGLATMRTYEKVQK